MKFHLSYVILPYYFFQKLPLNENLKVVNVSSVGVGADFKEIRLIIINKKLINNGKDNFKLINESDLQLVMDKKTANHLQILPNTYFLINAVV